MERSRVAFLLVALGAAGIAAGAIAYMMSRSSGVAGATRSVPGAVWVGVALAAAALGALLVHKAFVRRVDAVAGALSSRASAAAGFGLSYEPKGTAALRRSFSDVPGIPDSGKARHIMRGTIAGREAVVFEHTYMIYNGSTVTPVAHVIYATVAPSWPETFISPRSLLSRAALRFGWDAGLTLENADFNRLFRVKTFSEDFALTLLSPDMQQFMVDKPGVSWHFRPGRLCLVYRGTLNVNRLGASLDRVRSFWALVPEELGDWAT